MCFVNTGLSIFFIQAVCTFLASAQAPVFNITPVNLTAIQGQPVVLPCAVENKNEHIIIWANPRKMVLSYDDRRVIDDTRMSIERPFVRDWNLHIRNVKVQDEGEYTCQINTAEIQIKRIRLKVHVPAEIDNATSSSNVTVKEGEEVRLQCVASGIPEPAITWYRNTAQTNQLREHVGTTGEVLIIHNISRYCAGLYECEASNQISQPVRRVMNVEVEFPPEVYFRTPRRVSQEIGKEVMLECFVAAFPQGMGQWRKNGKAVGEGAENKWRYRTELYKPDHFTLTIYLTIMNLEKHDLGTYTCEASNALGTDKESIIVTEYTRPTPPPETRAPPIQPRHDHVLPSYQPPLNVGNPVYQNGYYNGKGEINANKSPSSGNAQIGFVASSYPSGSSTSRYQLSLWCILSTVLVTLNLSSHSQRS